MKLLKNSLIVAFYLSTALTPAMAANRCEDAFLLVPALLGANPPAAVQTPAKKSLINPGFEVSKDPRNLGKIKLSIFDERNVAWKAANALIRGIVKYPLGINKLNQVTKRFLEDTSGRPYFERLADAFQLRLTFEQKFLESIPKTGPVILMSNHPMNGIDGIALAAMISKVRPDVKVVLTKFLEGFPEMVDNSILVNPYGGPAAKAENAVKKEQMAQHLADGGALMIFPAGEVSTKKNLNDDYAMDPVWRTGVMQMVQRNPSIQVQTLFTPGQPSQAFQVAKKISGFTGLAMHIRELSSRIDSVVEVIIGPAQKGADLLARNDPQGTMDQLRSLTYALKLDQAKKPTNASRSMEEIPQEAFPGAREEMMSVGKKIFDYAPQKPDKSFAVYLVKGSDAPQMIKELGRLREITFRAANEGSGKALDVDKYDGDYFHLVAYDKEKGQIAGAYRLGVVGELLKARGLEGVYTREFFDYDQLLKSDFANTTIELGRAFVLPQYQGRSLAFPSLFGGIGQFLVLHPQYKNLMGTVSISGDYKQSSQMMMSEYLMAKLASEYAPLATSRTPVKFDPVLTAEETKALINPIKSLVELDGLIKGIEGDKKRGVPQLIKIYDELGAKYLGFNLDRDFNTLDGLIVVDLSKAPYEQLKKYLGEAGAKSYLEYHGQAVPTPTP